MASRQGQAHHIADDQVHAALLELKELAKLQKSRASSVLPHAEVSGTSGDRARKHVVPPVVVMSKPSIDKTQDDFQNVQAVTDRRSILGRSLRIVIHGLIAFVIVGAAFAWRSSDNNTKETVKAWGGSLTGLAFLRTINSDDATESSANVIAMPAKPTSIHSDQDSARYNATMPAAPVLLSTAAPTKASSELQQRLATISGDLAVVQRTLSELAAAQKNMAQDIATLQAAQQAVNTKTSLNPPPQLPRHRNASTESRSEPAVEPNSGPVTVAPAQSPLELH